MAAVYPAGPAPMMMTSRMSDKSISLDEGCAPDGMQSDSSAGGWGRETGDRAMVQMRGEPGAVRRGGGASRCRRGISPRGVTREIGGAIGNAGACIRSLETRGSMGDTSTMRPPTLPLRRALVLATVAAALALPIHATPAPAAVSLPTNFVDDTLVTGINLPTSMAFLPDGRLLFTEQYTGNVRMVVNGHIASTDPVYIVPSMNVGGYERGLEGIAVDPAWPTRPYVYLCYTRQGGTIRIERYTATGDLANASGENLVLGSPLTLIGDIPDQYPT